MSEEKVTKASGDVGSRPDLVRNICILAHVDHGKTTIADSLIATNGHISKRTAGNVRYLDDRKDEQERGITMKSSAISLQHKNNKGESMVINLIDTPGHIDFSTEVSAAIRICDGALVVVDIIEGVCVQTREALKQAFEERVRMILVINKLDRVFIELQKSNDLIFQDILRIIEDCNAYIAELCQFEMQCTVNEEDYLFHPPKGNVIFASAIDSWGITTRQMASMFVTVHNESIDSINDKMWDFDYYILHGAITKGAIEKKRTNLFVTLLLSTISYIYYTLRVRRDSSKYQTIINKLGIEKTTEMMHKDPKIQTKAILQGWKPIASTIFEQVTDIIPPPTQVVKDRFEYLVNPTYYFGNADLTQYAEEMMDHLNNCNKLDTPCIIYISKMFAVNKQLLERRAVNIVTGTRSREQAKQDIKTQETHAILEQAIKLEDNSTLSEIETPSISQENIQDKSELYTVIGLARIFSGVLEVGMEIYALDGKYRPPPKGVDIEQYIEKNDNIKKVKIKNLYILLGRELTPVQSVSPGNICGIGGLEKYIARTGTLSSSPYALPLTERVCLEPIVRNSIECTNLKDLPLLRKGLGFLKKVDSGVQVVIQESGEMVLVTAGDVHLAKCIEDIRNMIADIDINVSKPMVTLKETIVSATKRVDISKSSPHSVKCNLDEIGLSLSVTVVPLPSKIIEVITPNLEILKLIEDFEYKSGINIMMDYDNKKEMAAATPKVYNEVLMTRVKQHLKLVFGRCGMAWCDIWENIWSIGKPRGCVNILFNNTGDYKRNIFSTLNEIDVRSCLDHCVTSGFDMCCRAGPICEEPITHCAFIVHEYKIENYDALQEMDNRVQFIAGIPAIIKECFRNGFKEHMQRLMEPIFTTDIQVNTRILGKVYSVISRRHGKVLEAVGMDEVEKSFLVKAQIPVAESHDFANEIRKDTSGQANPNLRFSHYDIIDGDPYFNVDEDADEDEEEETSNTEAKRASSLRKQIRKRKGLKVDDQVVVRAEKQRTHKQK